MARHQLARTDEEIEDVMNLAIESDDNGTKWPGMTYEQGVERALSWVFGFTNDNPMDD